MWDLYLQAMNIPVWRLRQPSENTCIFYRLNNSRGQTVAWMIAEDTGEEDLLIKIAKALTPHIQKENAFASDNVACLILLGKNLQQLFSKETIKTVITASALSSSVDYKKSLWEKLKPLRVLFDE